MGTERIDVDGRRVRFEAEEFCVLFEEFDEMPAARMVIEFRAGGVATSSPSARVPWRRHCAQRHRRSGRRRARRRRPHAGRALRPWDCQGRVADRISPRSRTSRTAPPCRSTGLCREPVPPCPRCRRHRRRRTHRCLPVRTCRACPGSPRRPFRAKASGPGLLGSSIRHLRLCQGVRIRIAPKGPSPSGGK